MVYFIQSHFNLRTLLSYGLTLILVALFAVYVLFQARFLIAGPTITLTPGDQNPQKTRLIYLEGTAANIVRIALNGRQIYTDKTGYFKEALVLENGYTIATLSAEDRYGRTYRVEREFVFYLDDEAALAN